MCRGGLLGTFCVPLLSLFVGFARSFLVGQVWSDAVQTHGVGCARTYIMLRAPTDDVGIIVAPTHARKREVTQTKATQKYKTLESSIQTIDPVLVVLFSSFPPLFPVHFPEANTVVWFRNGAPPYHQVHIDRATRTASSARLAANRQAAWYHAPPLVVADALTICAGYGVNPPQDEGETYSQQPLCRD